MALTDFSVNKIRLWAVVGGVQIELTRVELEYPLSAIPRATLVCAIGRDVRSLLPANIHGVYDQLKVNVPITVWAEAAEVANSGISGGEWPIGPFIVFLGIIVGVGYRKSRSGAANLTLACRHFLVDLEFSYTPNKKTHPLNMGNFHNQAGIKMAGGVHFLISTLAKKYFTRDNVVDDYWARSLQPWMVDICNQRQIFEGEAVENGNDDAIGVLRMFEPFVGPVNPFTGIGSYKFGVPMSMNNFGIFGTRPGIDAIVTDASNEGLRAFLGATIWEKIVSDYGSRYLFSVCPMATRALVVPVIPGLKTLWNTIDPVEYDSISLSNFLPRPLRGVILETGANSMTGAWGLRRGGGQDIKTIGGRFENANMDEGMLYFREAPQWIANAVSQMAWSQFCARLFHGNAFAGGAGVPAPFPKPVDLRAQAKILWDEYAKAIYLYEVFKTRKGTVTGRIRFDIAPGSSIGLITTEEKFIKQTGVNIGEQILYGIVTNVSIMIDSEAVQGYTSFEVSYLRDEFENNDINLTTLQHPLWSKAWAGAPLVEQLFADPPPEIAE
jgi:hypothetical protein